jgi:hypothetical protein
VLSLFKHGGEILLPATDMALRIAQHNGADAGQTVTLVVNQAADVRLGDGNRAQSDDGLIVPAGPQQGALTLPDSPPAQIILPVAYCSQRFHKGATPVRDCRVANVRI